MKITIEGSPEEIASLVIAAQGRQCAAQVDGDVKRLSFILFEDLQSKCDTGQEAQGRSSN